MAATVVATAPMAAMPAAVMHLLDLGAGEIVLIGDGGLRRHGRLGLFQLTRRNQQRRGADCGARGSNGTGTGGNAKGKLQKFTTFHVLSSGWTTARLSRISHERGVNLYGSIRARVRSRS
jgi:hypothetical protein